MTFGYGFYLLKRVDSEFELLFMHCVALDLLLGFDNIVDIVGWYGTANLSSALRARGRALWQFK